MKSLSDRVVARLQADMQLPDLSGTRYSLVQHVASGGMGSVWLAEDTVLKRRVALKVLILQRRRTISTYAFSGRRVSWPAWSIPA